MSTQVKLAAQAEAPSLEGVAVAASLLRMRAGRRLRDRERGLERAQTALF